MILNTLFTMIWQGIEIISQFFFVNYAIQTSLDFFDKNWYIHTKQHYDSQELIKSSRYEKICMLIKGEK